MNQINGPTGPTKPKKEKKTAEPTRTTGTMKMVNGVAVMLPPDEGFQELGEEEVATILERNQEFVAVRVDEEEEATEEVQHVFDTDSEEKSRAYAAKIRAENDKRAKEAQMESKPKKVGSTIVAESNSYSDIELFEEQLIKEKELAALKDEDES